MDDLTRDDLAALANAHLLAACPGRITRIRVSSLEIAVDSILPSPFADRTPSRWVTIFSRVDGHVVTSDVIEMSVPVVPVERNACPHGAHDINTQRCLACGATTRERVEDRRTVGHPAQLAARPWLTPKENEL